MLDNNLLFIFIIVVNIFISSFISFSETALITANKNKILIKKNNYLTKFALKLLDQKNRMISAILIINTMANVLTSSLITAFVVKKFGAEYLVLLSFLTTIVLLIFGEILPKVLAMLNPNKYSIIVAPFIWFILKILYPIVILIEYCLKIIFFIFGLQKFSSQPSFSKEIKDLVMAYKLNNNKEKIEHKDENIYIKMVDAIASLNEMTIEQIMIHRLNVSYINLEDDIEKINQQIINIRHSRILVIEKDIDNIIGILNIKDILKHSLRKNNIKFNNKNEIVNLCQKPLFVFENTTLLKQLENFKQQNKHFAIVIDEYSVILGIITLADILEEIIGNVYDEYDNLQNYLQKISTNRYIILGTMPMHELIEELKLELKNDDECPTIAGYVINHFGYIPQANEEIEIKNYKFKIIAIENNKINKIELLIM